MSLCLYLTIFHAPAHTQTYTAPIPTHYFCAFTIKHRPYPRYQGLPFHQVNYLADAHEWLEEYFMAKFP